MPNPSVKRDWLTAGFARLQPVPYLQRWVSFSLLILPLLLAINKECLSEIQR